MAVEYGGRTGSGGGNARGGVEKLPPDFLRPRNRLQAFSTVVHRCHRPDVLLLHLKKKPKYNLGPVSAGRSGRRTPAGKNGPERVKGRASPGARPSIEKNDIGLAV